jgi:eukaryotic-like serine/threonine-protein kinase
MKALLELGGRSPGGTRRRWGTAGEGHPTVPEQLADHWPGEPGDRLVARRFRLRSLLGRGGMGRVWLADDELLDRPVAVKQLMLHGLESAEMRAQAWACALREARAAARVDHAGAVSIYDIVQEKGCPWIVMEPLPGRTLQQAVNEAGPLPVRQVTRVDVLQATHRAGIVHRDVTPGNVHLCDGGRVVLTDFGIACTIDDASPAAGTFPGTPAYVSPERLDGGDSGPACDLFSLGATLFTAVEGRPPFDRGSLLATLTAVLVDGPAPFLRAGPLRPVIEGLLAKDPRLRLSAGQARAALRAIQREHDTAQVRTSWNPEAAARVELRGFAEEQAALRRVADVGRGSGLVGLKDRVEALGGRVSLQSPAGAGTTPKIALPLDGPSDSGSRPLAAGCCQSCGIAASPQKRRTLAVMPAGPR